METTDKKKPVEKEKTINENEKLKDPERSPPKKGREFESDMYEDYMNAV